MNGLNEAYAAFQIIVAIAVACVLLAPAAYVVGKKIDRLFNGGKRCSK